MSNPQRAASSPATQRTLLLLSSNPLVRSSLRQHLQCSPFEMIFATEPLKASGCLTLFDAGSLSTAHFLSPSYGVRDAPMALVNVMPEQAKEILCANPWIKGVFYHGTTKVNFLRGIQALLAGEDWLPRDLMGELVNRYRQVTLVGEAINTLTCRERQVLSLAGQGLSNSAIGEHLHLSVHTVKSHIHNGLLKLGASNRAQGAALVLGLGESAAT